MKKRITEYRKRVDRLLADEEEKTYEEWECILEEHLVQIGFFQHERLIHLIVTVTFAVITVLDRKSTRLNSSHSTSSRMPSSA